MSSQLQIQTSSTIRKALAQSSALGLIFSFKARVSNWRRNKLEAVSGSECAKLVQIQSPNVHFFSGTSWENWSIHPSGCDMRPLDKVGHIGHLLPLFCKGSLQSFARNLVSQWDDILMLLEISRHQRPTVWLLMWCMIRNLGHLTVVKQILYIDWLGCESF